MVWSEDSPELLLVTWSGAIWDYLNPNSDHNKINGVEGKVDEIRHKYANELNALRNISVMSTRTLNHTYSEVHTIKNQLNQLMSDLPEYILAASYIMEHVQFGARLLDEVRLSCNQRVELISLSQLVQLPELANHKTADSTTVNG